MLEASPDDIEIVGAEYRVKGTPDKKKTLDEIAFALDLAFDAPEGMEPYLDETAYHDTPNCTWPFGTHIAVVEIDEETGKVDLVRYVAVDDVGKKINPLIVDGQLHGGIAQGVGQALWETGGLRRRRPAPVGLDARLRAAAGVVAAEPRARRDGHPVAGQPDRREGRRRGRRDRLDRRRRERGQRRARRRSASPISTCRSPPRPCGGPSSPRREARHDPRGVRATPGRPSLSDAVAAVGGGAKVIAGGQSLLPLLKLRLAAADKLIDIGRIAELKGYRHAAGRRRRDRRADDLRRVAGRDDLPERGRGDRADRRRPGPQPRARSAARSPTPIRRRTRRRSRWRSTVRRSSAGPAASGSCRSTGSSRARSRPAIRPDEILVAIRRGPVPARRAGSPTGSWPSRRRATRSSASRRSIAQGRRRHRSTTPRRRDRRPRARVPGRRTSRRRWSASDGSADASRRPPSTPPTASRSNSDIHADAEYRAAMAEVYTRPRDRGCARPLDAAIARPIGCASSGSSPGGARPTRSSAPCSRATWSSRGERWSKGRRLAAADLDALAAEPPGDGLTVAVLVPEPGDVHEDDAAARLAQLVAGDGAPRPRPRREPDRPASHRRRASCTCGRRARAAERIDPIEVFTAFDGSIVAAGQLVACVKVGPHLVSSEAAGRGGPRGRGGRADRRSASLPSSRAGSRSSSRRPSAAVARDRFETSVRAKVEIAWFDAHRDRLPARRSRGRPRRPLRLDRAAPRRPT